MSEELEPNYFEPTEITIGETPTWKKSLPDYLPADGWTLTYYFRGAGTGFDVIASEDNGDFLIEVPTASTGAMAAGVYYWQAWISKGSEKYMVDSGEVKAKQTFVGLNAATTVDNRSTNKKILDAIDAMIQGKATVDQQEYAIGNRQLRKIPIQDLIQLRKYYANLYAQERRAEKLKQGASFTKTIRLRFKNPC